MTTATLLHAEQALCYYQNRTSRLQVIRGSEWPQWNLERVVFPGQLFLFEAPLNADLEIYDSNATNAVPLERIQCRRLQVSHSQED